MEASHHFAEFLTEIKFKDLSPTTVEIVKKEVLDTLATALGGGRSQGVREVYELVRDWGGKGESSIINFGGKFPSPNAALVNSIMSHSLDYDDTHDMAKIHPGCVAVPTAFAVAEAESKTSGKDFITAIAAGVDFGCRLGLAAKLAKPNVLEGGWHNTSLYGYFISAAVAGKLYGLDKAKLINALGVAYHQAAGNIQCMMDGALTKRMGAGFSARGGITAALMAGKGITGATNILEGEVGLFNLYHAGFDRHILLDGLGKKFEIEFLSFKPYPCCRLIHSYVDAINKLVVANDLGPEEVLEINVPHSDAALIVCEPWEIKTSPRNVVDAQFSIPWALACAVVRRKVGIQEFTREAIGDPSLLNMAKKVKPLRDSALPNEVWARATVEVKTRGGELKIETGYPLGSPENPLSLEEIEKKLIDCASHSLRRLSKKRLKDVAEMVKNLEELEDVAQVIAEVTE